jgi:hypothetical protein
MEAWRTVEAQNGGLYSVHICMPVVADSHNLDEEQDPDLH